MNDYRVIVTGSRDWIDRGTLVAALEEARSTALRAGRRLVVVHGACPTGADARAHQWVNATGTVEESHPADWKTGGRGAGFARNQHMVNLGADVVFAFPMPCSKDKCDTSDEHYSHGTADCMRRAVRSGIEVRQFTARPVVAR